MDEFSDIRTIVFFSYLIVRTSAIQTFSSDFSYLLLRREIQTVLSLLMLVTVKLVKEESWEGFVSDVLFFSKGFHLGNGFAELSLVTQKEHIEEQCRIWRR